MSKHTEGQWEIQKGLTAGKEVISPSAPKARRVIARCGGPDRDGNSCLIAAAPDLLEALIEVAASLAWNAQGECRGINDGPIMPSNGAVEMAKAAIAKARGEA